MDEKMLALWLLGGSLVATVIAFGLGSTLGSTTFFLLLFALLACPASIMVYKYGYWVIPYFTRGLRTIRTQDALFEMPPSEDVLVKYEGGAYTATLFLGVRIFKSSTAMGEDEKAAFMSLWERAVSGMKSVVKFGTLIYIKDLSKYRESIESRKAKAQMLLGQEREKPNPDQAYMERVEREIAMWDNIQSRLSVGEKPTAISTFIQASATGATRDAAIAAARAHANEIRATVGTALNVEVIPLSGEEMKRCFDWAYAVPPGIREF